MRTSKILNSTEYRIDEQFQNLPIFFSQILIFQIEKILEIC